MNTLIFLIILGLIHCENTFAINLEEVNKIKTLAKWEVQDPSSNMFKGWTIEQVKKLMGYMLPESPPEIEENSNQMGRTSDTFSLGLPTDFDGRNELKQCLAPIKNQGNCGSCWAHATVDTFSVMRCLKLKIDYEQMSIQDMVSCDMNNGACKGGRFGASFSYLVMKGVVTDSCVPYTSGENGTVPKCLTKACKSSKQEFIKHKCLKRSSVNLGNKINFIKKWLMNNGPLSVGFEVFSDFMSYKSGVYEHVSGTSEGGHAVLLVGWGTIPNSETTYWICQNSWDTRWGMDGFFYIKMHECYIDSLAYSCLPAD